MSLFDLSQIFGSGEIVEALDIPDCEVYYRYSDSNDIVYLEKHRVLRHTAKGVWIDNYGEEKFVLSDPNGRRFAYADKSSALNSYRRRKEWQIRHAKNTIERAEYYLKIIGEVE